MSGTSMDGVDAIVARFDHNAVSLPCTLKSVYPDELRQRLRTAVTTPAEAGIDEVGELDTWVGECFASAVTELLERANLQPADIVAIGSHGQTLRHRPDAAHRFTMQIGNPAIIATSTGIDTIADFRRSDVALAGQGAPLVPPFHQWLFRSAEEHRTVLNIGGIANLTVLPASGGNVSGFDTGPGNTLLDAWILKHHSESFDDAGRWASTGSVDDDLLQAFMSDEWFSAVPPKSTGVELFNLNWIKRFGTASLSPADVQATLLELTAVSVAAAVDSWAPDASRVYVCGGGVHNEHLMSRLRARLDPRSVESTAQAGLDPDWVEAAAFAWLAMRYRHDLPGNLPRVTGASRETILGAAYRA